MSCFRQSNSFLNLPTEIRLQIYESCKCHEQKQLRQINRQFERELTPILFDKLHVDAAGLDTKALVKLTNILTAVRSLVISNNMLISLSLQAFRRELWWYLDYNAEHWQQSKKWIKYSFKRYEAHRISQSFQLGKLALTLKSFQNLKTLKIIRLHDFQVSTYWRRLEQEICAPNTLSLERWTTGREQGHGVVSALWPSRLHCNLFTVDYYYVPLLCWNDLEEISSWKMLKNLRLHIATGNSVIDSERIKLSLQKVLAVTKLLESLYLTADPCLLYSNRFNFSDILLNVSILTRLQELTLITNTIKEKQLVRIFQIYSNLLRRFTLADTHLFKGLWKNVIDFFRNSIGICHFELEGITEGNGWYINTVIPFGKSIRIEQIMT